MGVQSLYSWIKKTRPQTITTIRNRFSDPRIRGKRVALDATLITNVLHFRNKEDVGGKQALIGWYTMIREMRAAKVEPIAIWDQRGTREWKAAEAKKRLATRALLLARRNHEDERATRLQSLKETLIEVQKLPEEEQKALREHWAKESWTKYGPPESQQAVSRPTMSTGTLQAHEPPSTASQIKVASIPTPAAAPAPAPVAPTDVPISTPPSTAAEPEKTSSAPTEPTSGEITGISAFAGIVSKLSPILESYRLHDRPRESLQNEIQPSTAEALGHIRDLEVFNGEPAEAGQVETIQSDRAEGAKERDLEIDGKLQELVPFEEYTETATQQGLTVAEGHIIDTLLGISQDHQAGVETMAPPRFDLRPELERLDRIIEVVPEVRQIYARALKLPSRSDHDDCRELLIRLGVPVLIAEVPYEAEGLASSLARRGLVDFVATEDSDVLGYEGPLLRYVGTSSRALQYISGQTVREQSDLTPEEYLDFIVLLGTDASPRIRNVGPANAYKLIKRYGSIEKILEEETKIRERIPEGYMDMVKAARGVFSDLPEVPSNAVLEQGVWEDYEVCQWLEEEHGLSLIHMEDRDGIEPPRWSQLPDDGRFDMVYDGMSEVEPDWEELVKSAIEELEGLDEQLQDDSVLKNEHPWSGLSERQIMQEEGDFFGISDERVTEEDWGNIAEEELRKME